MEGQRRLVVKSVSGQTKQFTVSPDVRHRQIPIEELKKLVADEFGTPADRQRLIFQGKLLKDGSPLSEYIREDDITIHMMARAPDAPPERGPGPVPGPQGMPFNIAESLNAAQGMLNQMLGGIFPGMQPIQVIPGQVLAGMQSAQVPGPEIRRVAPVRPPAPHHHHHPPRPAAPPHSAPPQSAPPVSGSPAAPADGHRREVVLPFAHVSNIGSIVNALMGPGANFPPPRMPALNVDRNPLVLLGGFLSTYQFQIMRLIPFISRIGDLMQRESLISDPQERGMLQQIANRVGDALFELDSATRPVIDLLRNLQIGPQPGQFRIIAEGHPVVGAIPPDQRHAAPRADQPEQPEQAQEAAPASEEQKQSSSPSAEPAQAPQPAAPRQPHQSNESPPQPAPQLPQFLQSQLTSMLGSMFGQGPNSNSESNPAASAISTVMQFFTGGSTLRRVLESQDAQFLPPQIPMTEFILDLNFQGLLGMLRGNLDYLQRMQQTVRQNIRNIQAEGRSLELNSLIPEFSEFSFRDCFLEGIQLPPDYDYDATFIRRTNEVYSQLLDITMNTEGLEFARQFGDAATLYLGEFVDSLANILPRGEAQIMDLLVRSQDFGMAMTFVRPVLNGHMSRARQTFLKRRQDQAPPVDEVTKILSTWQRQIERDQVVQTNMSPQRPLSIAYRSGDSGQPRPPFTSPTDFFFEAIQATLNQHDVEIPNSVPVHLLQMHEAELAARLQERAAHDPDFTSDLFPALDESLNQS